MQDASTYLKCPALLSVGNIIFNAVPEPNSGFDWFHLKFDNGGPPITKIVAKTDIKPLEDLSGVVWVPVVDSHELRPEPSPVYRLVMPGELYFSDEADAVYIATWVERHREKILEISTKFATKGRDQMNLHGVLHMMGLWNEHLF